MSNNNIIFILNLNFIHIIIIIIIHIFYYNGCERIIKFDYKVLFYVYSFN